MVIALIFNENEAITDAIQFVRKTLETRNFQVTAEGSNVLAISANKKLINDEGQNQAMFKRRKSPDHGPWFTFVDNGRVALSEFVPENECEFMKIDDRLWTSSEVTLLTRRALGHVPIDLEKLRGACKRPDVKLEDGSKPDQNFLHSLLREGIVTEVVPMHDNVRSSLPIFPTKLGLSVAWIDSMKDYFGARVAFYFVFMQSFTIWLMLPGIIGMALFLLRPKGVTIDNSAVVPFFSAFMVIYSAIFVRLLDRINIHWACRWGMLDVNKNAEKRSDFHGTWETSPITKHPELTYPWEKRLLWFGFSALVTSGMLMVSFGVMILSLNLQGYIHGPFSVVADGMERFSSPLFFEMVGQWAEPGALLDPSGAGDTLLYGYVTFVPVILHSVCILILNNVYSGIAKWLTVLENHETDDSYTRSLCLKRFLFEAFDCYVVLFYIAFFIRDVEKLRSELVGLYTVDAFRRILLETVVPLLQQHASSSWRHRQSARKKKDDDAPEPMEEFKMPEYEDFDDWLEMVIEFGYITLFAGAFPLASCLSFFCNILEIFSDAFKLKRVYRRPMADRAAAMPSIWLNILKSMVVLSIVTNCLIFGVCSSQMEVWFPSLYTATQFDQQSPKSQALWVMFLVEHVMCLLCLLCYTVIPSLPQWVRIAVRRREHYTNKVLHEEFMRKSTLQTHGSQLLK